MKAAIIVAAGEGTRFAAREPKAFVPLAGVPLMVHSITFFEKAESVSAMVLVVAPAQRARAGNILAPMGLRKLVAVVPGGRTRAGSVARGLAALPAAAETVLVHDAARPLLTAALLERLLAVSAPGPVIPALPVTDTLKEVSGDLVARTLDRRRCRLVQTPQVFPRALLEGLYREIMAGRDPGITDDALLAEQAGVPVRVVPGERSNIKVTWPEDLLWAETLLRERARTGSPAGA